MTIFKILGNQQVFRIGVHTGNLRYLQDSGHRYKRITLQRHKYSPPKSLRLKIPQTPHFPAMFQSNCGRTELIIT